MRSSDSEQRDARARQVTVSDEALAMELDDGRTISAPIAWLPRLWYGTLEERAHFEIIGDGACIRWPDLDEDLTVSGIVYGHRSAEESRVDQTVARRKAIQQFVQPDCVTRRSRDF